MIRDKIISFSTIAIFIGVSGVLSAIVTLFINVNSQLSVKWFLFLLLIFFTIVSILVKLTVDLTFEKKGSLQVFEQPIKSSPDQEILVIRTNSLFNHNCLVGGYFVNDEVETFAFVGYVYHIQEKMVQIKITALIEGVVENSALFERQTMKKIIIRPVIPFGFMNMLEK